MKYSIHAAALFALLMTFGMGHANAHSVKEATQPEDGAVLEASPEEIGMTFDMPMRVTLFTLTDQDGAAHDVLRTDDMQPVDIFSAKPPQLPAGQYKVEWRGLATDGHPMQGTFSFEIAK